MISKRTRRPLNDILSDLTFSHLAPMHRPDFVDLSKKGVMRRMRIVFRRFTGGATKISALQWRRLCKDCDLITKKFTPTDADAVFSAAAARGNLGIHVAIKDAG